LAVDESGYRIASCRTSGAIGHAAAPPANEKKLCRLNCAASSAPQVETHKSYRIVRGRCVELGRT